MFASRFSGSGLNRESRSGLYPMYDPGLSGSGLPSRECMSISIHGPSALLS